MSRNVTASSRVLALAAFCLALQGWPAVAQVRVRPVALPLSAIPDAVPDAISDAPSSAISGKSSDASTRELAGVVLDDRGQPLVGAVITALGGSSTFAVSDKDGRFLFRTLPQGAYLLRANLEGYQPGRVRVTQAGLGARQTSTITLTRLDGQGQTNALSAGAGAQATTSETPQDVTAHEHGELAWRLRHLKRSVLKDAAGGIPGFGPASPSPIASLWREPMAGLGRAVDGPVRVASALFADLGLDGQVNFLTTASFDRPQDLLNVETRMPRGVALVSLETSGPDGQWRMRGALTQGDLSSWLVHGAYVRTAPSSHQL